MIELATMNRICLILITGSLFCFSSCDKREEVAKSQKLQSAPEPAVISGDESKLSAEQMERNRRKAEAWDKLMGRKPVEPENTTTPVRTGTRFDSVEAYFKDGNPNPLTHRKGLPNYERNVSNRTKREVKERDGNCCLVCGSTYKLEVDHRIALMNGGGNSVDNLGTLCDDCHNKKTRYDYAIRKRRQKESQKR